MDGLMAAQQVFDEKTKGELGADKGQE